MWTLENYFVVALGASLLQAIPFRAALGCLRLAKRGDYILAVIAWCLTAALLVAFYDALGLWALVILSLTAVLARQVLVRSDRVLATEARVGEQGRIIAGLSDRIARERKEERLSVATHLHDEVVQSLFQLSLLCQVLRRDLDSGRLLDLESDLPALGAACDLATEELRRTIRGLRGSPVGMRGLAPALRVLVRDVQSRVETTIQADICDLAELDPRLQLVIYQIAKEALTNATHHAKAATITVTLCADSDGLSMRIVDDGIKFDPYLSRQDHFGLLIMQERAETVGGELYIDSTPGSGTIVSGHFPRELKPAD